MIAGFLKVLAEHGRKLVASFRIKLFQCFAHGVMERAATVFKQRVVSRILDERVPEEVFEFRLSLG
jgi:hypothetical protein